MWDHDEYQGDFYEHNFFSDSASDRDYAALALSESKMQHGHKAPWEEETDEEEEEDTYAEGNVQRSLAILRTNHQVYSEASSVLYSGLVLSLQPGDVLCLNTGKDIVKASERVWRHNPLLDVGTTNLSGQTVYATPELDGVMEPHVLARFTKINFSLEFDWDPLEAGMTQQTEGEQTALVAPSLFVNENLTVDPQDEAKLLAFYKRSTIIHQLVKILSNSPHIVRLEIVLDIEVLAEYDSDFDSNSDENEETHKKMTVANKRAVELFLDSGLLAPLDKLSNVQSFGFDIIPEPIDLPAGYKGSPKQARALNALKQKIERNYAVKDD